MFCFATHRTRKGPHTRVQAPKEPAIVHMAQGTAEELVGSCPSASVHLGLPGSHPENTARLSPHPILPPAPSPARDCSSCNSKQGHPLRFPLSQSLQQGTQLGPLTGTLRRPDCAILGGDLEQGEFNAVPRHDFTPIMLALSVYNFVYPYEFTPSMFPL